MKQVARELNVRFVVAGSVRRMGERMRISVQLVDAETGNDIWVEKFDRRSDEIFAVLDRVVQTLVSTLVGRVQVSVNERSRRKPPASLAAYECVLKCNALPGTIRPALPRPGGWWRRRSSSIPSMQWRTRCWRALSYSRWEDGPQSSDAALEKAYVLAMRAVELDDSESTCQALWAHVCCNDAPLTLAVQYSRRAVELNPNNQWNAADLGRSSSMSASPKRRCSGSRGRGRSIRTSRSRGTGGWPPSPT